MGATAIVWVAKEISEEHRRAVDWLNEITNESVGFFALEVELWAIDTSPPAPKFNLVSQPNEWAKSLSAGSATGKPSETKLLQLEFWRAFVDYCKREGIGLNLRTPRPQHWYTFAVGRSRFNISLTVNTMKHRVGCEIYIRRSEPAFQLLEAQKNEIEASLGPLEWLDLPHRRAGRIAQFREGNIEERREWAELVKWMKERVEAFHGVFSPRIRALHLSDEEEGQDFEAEVDRIS